MSPSPARGSTERQARFVGPVGLLGSIARAASDVVSHSFDRLLAGMVAAGQGIEALCSLLCLMRPVLDDHLARLGLPTPHSRPRRAPGRRGWQVLDTIRMIVWRMAGVHPEVIGARLGGRSAGAVRAKARRVGVPAPLRRLLFRCDFGTLQDPDPGVGLDSEPWRELRGGEASCGRAAGAASVRGGSAAVQGASAPPAPVLLGSLSVGAADPRVVSDHAPVRVCGRAAGAVSIRGGGGAVDCSAAAFVVPPEAPVMAALPAPVPAAAEPAAIAREVPSEPAAVSPAALTGITQSPAGSAAGAAVPAATMAAARGRWGPFAEMARAVRQRELPLLGVVGGTTVDSQNAAASVLIAEPPRPPIPRSIEEIDLSGDLRWFRDVKHRRTSEVAAWACGMLVMGGLHWVEIAKKFDVTEATLRTYRSLIGAPVDPDRSKITRKFDERVARATQKESGYVLRESMGSGDKGSGLRQWFWVHKSQLRSTHFAPAARRRESYEPRSNIMRIVIEAASGRAPQRSSVHLPLLRGGVVAPA